MVLANNPSTQEAEARGLELKVTLSYRAGGHLGLQEAGSQIFSFLFNSNIFTY